MSEIIIEKWATLTVIDDKWGIQLWPANAEPVGVKMYRLRVKVPELIGEAEATASDTEKKERR